ncbi:hypothetical protein MTO96_026608 [Rhipicephalus appendiculatus]
MYSFMLPYVVQFLVECLSTAKAGALLPLNVHSSVTSPATANSTYLDTTQRPVLCSLSHRSWLFERKDFARAAARSTSTVTTATPVAPLKPCRTHTTGSGHESICRAMYSFMLPYVLQVPIDNQITLPSPHYLPMDAIFVTSEERGREEKAVTGQETTLVDLRKYTNYFIQVAAFTQRGLGTESEPVFCRTMEDVPDAPEDVKLLTMSATSLLVAWKPPVHRNGLITMYSIYAKTQEKQRDAVSYELQSLPARIVDFDEIIHVAPSEDVRLSCRFLGTAPVHWEWKNGDAPVQRSNRTELSSDGSLSLRLVDATSAGNYTCHVRNRLANDRRIVALIVRAHVEGFVLKVVSQTATSLQMTASGSAVDDQVVQACEYRSFCLEHVCEVWVHSRDLEFCLYGFRCFDDVFLEGGK